MTKQTTERMPVSPAPAGMIPNRALRSQLDQSEPRTRGDDPSMKLFLLMHHT